MRVTHRSLGAIVLAAALATGTASAQPDGPPPDGPPPGAPAMTPGALGLMPPPGPGRRMRVKGFGGGFAAQSSGLETQDEGLSLLRDGRLIDEAREVMALVKQHGAALATGHVSFEEIRALVAEAEAQGFRKLILTHPYDRAPGLTLAQVEALARPHVRIEFVFCSITPNWRFTDAATIAHCIRTLGVARFVISSDGGQAHNPMPAEGYRRFVHALHAEGIAAEDFRVMCRDNGAFLIDG